ncbi:unnamed protein product [Leptosia nina]|uniref:Uncharacterized protein n=1 Tax=Leptosia nina TaxID=320188 RepID=A0AAV1IT12_9NEOP
MSERFKVTKHDEPSGKNYKNYGATSAENDVELKGKLLPDSDPKNSLGSESRLLNDKIEDLEGSNNVSFLVTSFNSTSYRDEK